MDIYNKKKILLFTDVPPSPTYSGGLYLWKVISTLPREMVACYTLNSRYVNPTLPPELSWMQSKSRNKPKENWGTYPYGGYFLSLFMEYYTRIFYFPEIINDVVDFGKSIGTDALWVPLQGQVMIQLARPIAKRLGVPLYSLVYDPPDWWLRANKVAPFIAKQVKYEFQKVLEESKRSAFCSWAMADYYHNLYGIDTIPMIASLDQQLAQGPAEKPHVRNEFHICMAGQMYATQEWNALLAALHSVSWRISGKIIKIKLLVPYVCMAAEGKPSNIEFLGWRSQEETIQIFSESDLLYCPYWFSQEYEQEARLSYPSKLTAYLASGRPVFFHGPEYASPAKFLKDHNAAALCHSLNISDIIETLEQIITDEQRYAALSKKGRETFDRYLTMESMQLSVSEFLGLT